jgi:cation:H+ antiporter
MTAVGFALSLVLIIVASELFTNAVEWAGYRLKLGSGATGSLLAALGTSLPESTVPVVALIAGAHDADAVAMGAVIGSPMLLLGVGMGITGLAVMVRRRRPRLEVGTAHARRDILVFLGAFSVISAVAAIGLPRPVRIVFGLALVVGYALYVRSVLSSGEPEENMPEPLHFLRWDADRTAGPIAITLQLLVSIGLLILASTIFVSAISSLADVLHLDALTVAVVLAPVATELPETLNSVLWVRSDDDVLAFGNVAGSSVFQACLLGALGLCFTTWDVGRNGIISMVATLVTATYLATLFWRRGSARGQLLALAVVPWIAYVVISLVWKA